MKKKVIFYLNRIREHLWFKPFIFCIISVIAALMAQQADDTQLNNIVPEIESESIEWLLDILSASMLVISIFAVASMLSAFSAASNTATPRSFHIVVTDDVSQYSLSIFIGSFIFSIVASVALVNGYYDKAGKFILFLITLLLFISVILTFLRWVDRISRLGRMDHTIMQVEQVATKSLKAYIKNPFLQARAAQGEFLNGKSVYGASVGYVQHIDMEALQKLAEKMGLHIRLNCLPGKFIHENAEVAAIRSSENVKMEEVIEKINESIQVGPTRVFDEDPRFGFIALSEIASRALSPGINDPGTAIQIIGSQERLLFLWNGAIEDGDKDKLKYERVEASDIPMQEFFDDAFRPVSRDGAGNIEVMLRLQKAFRSLYTIPSAEIKAAAQHYSAYAYNSAEMAIQSKEDLKVLEAHCLYKQ